MTAKKNPSLSDLVKKETPVVETSNPDEENPPVVDDDPTVTRPDDSDYPAVLLIPSDQNPVHTWEENQDHNLATLHPDIVEPIPGMNHSEPAYVTRGDAEWAGEAEQDDKGFK